MSVERKCDCGAMMGAYDLGCKICGKSYKVRDEFLVGKDILPEPPVDLWAAQQREAQSKRKSRTYKPAPRRAPSRSSSSTNLAFTLSIFFLLTTLVLFVILFREPLTTTASFLPFTILVITLLISFIALLSSSFFENIVMSPSQVVHNREYYRLISSGFGHINAGHFILNAITLVFFGPPLMDFLIDAYYLNAPLVFLLIYISAIVVADLPDLIRHRHNPGYSSVGASGAISAVVAGAAISDPNLEVLLFFIPGLAVPGVVYALGYLAISLYFDYRGNGRVAHLAHAAGTVYGLVIVVLISAFIGLGFFDRSNAYSNYSLNSESNTTQSESSDSYYLVEQLNSSGQDYWEIQSQEIADSWGASEVIWSGDCWIFTFPDTFERQTFSDSWYDLPWEGEIPELWTLDNQALGGPSAYSSCVVTAAQVLNWDLG
jgi:membrane associated rhomboid family serine protease